MNGEVLAGAMVLLRVAAVECGGSKKGDLGERCA
jgi:hypothetical protein